MISQVASGHARQVAVNCSRSGSCPGVASQLWYGSGGMVSLRVMDR